MAYSYLHSNFSLLNSGTRWNDRFQLPFPKKLALFLEHRPHIRLSISCMRDTYPYQIAKSSNYTVEDPLSSIPAKNLVTFKLACYVPYINNKKLQEKLIAASNLNRLDIKFAKGTNESTFVSEVGKLPPLTHLTLNGAWPYDRAQSAAIWDFTHLKSLRFVDDNLRNWDPQKCVADFLQSVPANQLSTVESLEITKMSYNTLIQLVRMIRSMMGSLKHLYVRSYNPRTLLVASEFYYPNLRSLRLESVAREGEPLEENHVVLDIISKRFTSLEKLHIDLMLIRDEDENLGQGAKWIIRVL